MPEYNIKHHSKAVTDINVKFKGTGEKQWLLLQSDEHFDSVKCDRTMYQAHLEEAVNRDALIVSNGDLFDAMQGRWDPRGTYEGLRPEFKVNNYLQKVEEEAAEFLAPYAKHIVMLGHGNHETSVIKRHNHDLTHGLTSLLNRECGTHIKKGGFDGWFRIFFSCGERRGRINIYRHHGWGGNAVVTKGTLQPSRLAPVMPDAHIVITGHDHNEWTFPITRHRVTQQGRCYTDEQLHVRVPGYKKPDPVGDSGWAKEKGFAPNPTGAVWVWFKMLRSGEIQYDTERAK